MLGHLLIRIHHLEIWTDIKIGGYEVPVWILDFMVKE